MKTTHKFALVRFAYRTIGFARGLDRNVPLYNLRTLDHQIDTSLLNERLLVSLSTAFGALAAFLAMVGLYGVMVYTVTRRTREIIVGSITRTSGRAFRRT